MPCAIEALFFSEQEQTRADYGTGRATDKVHRRPVGVSSRHCLGNRLECGFGSGVAEVQETSSDDDENKSGKFCRGHDDYRTLAGAISRNPDSNDFGHRPHAGAGSDASS